MATYTATRVNATPCYSVPTLPAMLRFVKENQDGKKNMTFFIDNFMRRTCSMRGNMTQESVENFSGKITGDFSYKGMVKTWPYRPKLECMYVCMYVCIYIYIYTYLLHGAGTFLRS